MKFLIISTDSADISTGGIERHMKTFIDFCIHNNKEVLFLLPSLEDRKEAFGNTVIYKKSFLLLKTVIQQGQSNFAEEELEKKSAQFWEFLLEICENDDIALINVHEFHRMPLAFNEVLWRLSDEKKLPLILSLHMPPAISKTSLAKAAIVNNAHWEKIVFVSKNLANHWIENGVSANKAHVQYLGVDHKDFNPNLDRAWLKNQLTLPPESRIILCASRLTTGRKDILQQKGILNLVSAFTKVLSNNKNVKLVIAAAPPPKVFNEQFDQALATLKSFAEKLGVKRELLVRQFTMDQMPLVYSGADIFTLVSDHETFGQVFIEAMACGTPVIGTTKGGVPEIIQDGLNGFLVEPNDPRALSEKIELLLDEESARKQFIEKGLEAVENNFSAQKQLNALLRHFEKWTLPNAD